MPNPHNTRRNKSPRPRKKSRNKSRTLTQEERIAAARREQERLDHDLYLRIAAWAKIWEQCVLPGCRRNGRCLHENACRMHEDVDDDWPPPDVGRAILDSLERFLGEEPKPKYDGDKVR